MLCYSCTNLFLNMVRRRRTMKENKSNKYFKKKWEEKRRRKNKQMRKRDSKSKHSGFLLLWNELGWLSLLKKTAASKMFFTLWSNWSSVGVLRLNSQWKKEKKNPAAQSRADWWLIHQNQKEGENTKCGQLTKAVGKTTDGCCRKKREREVWRDLSADRSDCVWHLD